jgi:CheY-like chemotaxis protein
VTAAAGSVLVVEDEALLLFTIADDLRAEGYRVLEATSASAALAMLEAAGPVDVLFTDVDMGTATDGLALARLVHQRWPKTQIIVTSGHVDLSDRDLPPGGLFVGKPYLPATILSSIRARRRRATRTAARRGRPRQRSVEPTPEQS